MKRLHETWQTSNHYRFELFRIRKSIDIQRRDLDIWYLSRTEIQSYMMVRPSYYLDIYCSTLSPILYVYMEVSCMVSQLGSATVIEQDI